MSCRTIVEFNHDYAYEIDRDPEGFVRAIRSMLNAGATLGPAGREITDPLSIFGVRCTPTTHHSVERKVILGDWHETKL